MARAKTTQKNRRNASAAASTTPQRRHHARRGGKPTQLAFEALAIEGGLLSPDWLARAAQLEAGGQSEADYRILKGLNLRDEIGRYWRIAQALWSEFVSGRIAGADEERRRALAERFVTSMLRDCFGFASITKVEPAELDGRAYPIGHAALEGRVPVVIAPAAAGIDALSSTFGDGARRRSAFGLCQELLNAEDRALWGIASDGLTMRILRDNASLTRPAWIEADLGRIFTEERYADFTALWLIAHETRFGRPGQPVTECSLEAWREAGREEGTRAREQLRHGVEEALLALGRGFLAHPENQPLRAALSRGTLTKEVYFQELLRLAYRLIFLLTVEERGVLHPEGSDEGARKLYADGYSLRRLRERAVKRSAHDRHHDQWEAVKIAFRGLARGEPRLALPALAGIFAMDQCPSVDAARLENRFLMLALFRLSWLREEAGLARVNWRDMGPEELGSVYESLLELVPQITEGGRAFSFATGAETKGHARKTTGSYYTPDSLVQVLLDSALEPVVDRTVAERPTDSIEALLSLSIVDPACGSGHFLLAAARRLAAHVARLQANGTPSAAEYRRSLRQVVGRCIHGVDLNPMAVELCRVSLWMEAVEPGLPLTFLDSHIRHGNALLGTTPELMAKGIPDDAWNPIEGDDKKVASALKKRNTEAEEGQRGLDTLWSKPTVDEAAELRKAIAAVDLASDVDAAALAEKEARWQQLLESEAYQHQKLVADAWCAASVWPKQPGPLAEAAPTNDLWRQIRDGKGQPPELTVKTVHELAEQYTFFHWHLAFPQVFARGGFDVVLGNPPWEKLKLIQQEFFAERSEDVARARNASHRKMAIAELATAAPALWSEWNRARRIAEGQSQFVRMTGRYPLCGRGDVNTYALFAELNRALTRKSGRAGFIVPSGIATDDTTKSYFQEIVGNQRLVALIDFQSGGELFGDIGHSRFKFSLVTLGAAEKALFAFGLRSARELDGADRTFVLTKEDIELLNPNTRTCPIFLSKRDAAIVRRIYTHVPVLVREARDGLPEANPWGIAFTRMFDMSNDSHLFHNRSELEKTGWVLDRNSFVRDEGRMLPLYEAKMVNFFDHRAADVIRNDQLSSRHNQPEYLSDADKADADRLPIPQSWVAEAEVARRTSGVRKWLAGFRDITSPTNERTVIAAIIPWAAAGNKFPVIESTVADAHLLVTQMSSFVFDYASRTKVGGVTLNYFIVKQFPALAPDDLHASPPWLVVAPLVGWLLPRVLELTYTAWDLEPFARDVGYEGPPFRWDHERRFFLRAELDAAFFHLYGIKRDDVDYIMDTFPIVRRNDEKAHGEYRTKRVILEIYDEMAEVAHTGKPYQTRLDPPPADPRVAHPPRDAKIITLRPAVRPLPEVRPAVAAAAFNIAAVGTNDWGRPHAHERGEVQAAIVATLKAFAAPTGRPQARLAALLCLEPHLIAAHLDETERASWARVVGADARKAVDASVDGTTHEWGAALSGLRARGRLVENLQQNTWELGTGTDAIDTRGWADGRAGFVVNVLRRLQTSTTVDAIIIELPAAIRQWLENAA